MWVTITIVATPTDRVSLPCGTVEVYIGRMDQGLATVEFGALVSWVGAMTCWQALVWAHKSWFKNPTNKAKYLNEANKMFLSCIGKPDSQVNHMLPFNCHPPTISQMIGDAGNPTGAMMMAVGLPGLILIIVGNVMLYGAGVEHYSRAGVHFPV